MAFEAQRRDLDALAADHRLRALSRAGIDFAAAFTANFDLADFA